jgi:hypothetical protein
MQFFFFLCLISNTPLATAAARRNTCSCPCSADRQNGMVWWCAFRRTGCYRIACGRIGRSSSQILLLTYFYLFGILKVRGERFVPDGEVSVEVGCEYRIRTDSRRGRLSCFSRARLLKCMDMCRTRQAMYV